MGACDGRTQGAAIVVLMLIRFAPRSPTLRATSLSHEPFRPGTRSKALGVAAGETEGAVLQRIKELEHQGFQFEAAEGSFEMLLRRASTTYRAPFELEDFTVMVEKIMRPCGT